MDEQEINKALTRLEKKGREVYDNLCEIEKKLNRLHELNEKLFEKQQQEKK